MTAPAKPPPNPLAERGARAAQIAKRKCEFCHELIVWTRTRAERDAPRMPIDYTPAAAGNVVLTEHDKWGIISGALGSAAKRAAFVKAGWPLHLPHRLTCPFVDEWTRPGGPKRGKQQQPPRRTGRRR